MTNASLLAQGDDAHQMTLLGGAAPNMAPGDYTLEASQTLSAASSAIPSASLTFTVTGPRFSLPARTIAGQFPPANSTGAYTGVFPHVVLRSPTLPWQRSSASGAQVPWLAVLVFAPGELNPTQGLVADLFPASYQDTAGNTGTLPATTISAFGGLNTLNGGELLSDPSAFVDLSTTQFTNLIPTTADLTFLSHVRTLSDAAAAATLDASADDTRSYSVVVSNALVGVLAQTTALNAIVVSLEAIASRQPFTQDTVRLPVLYQWSFSTTSSGDGFAEILENTTASTWAIPYGGSDPTVQAATELGYTALTHMTRQGGITASWYRGPLQPMPNPSSVTFPVASADDLLCYDPTLGMFDISLSAAWTLGQLMALNSGTFAGPLASLGAQWRRAKAGLTESLARHAALGLDPAPPKGAARRQHMLDKVLAPALKAGLSQSPRTHAIAPEFGVERTLAARRETPAAVGLDLLPAEVSGAIIEWLSELNLLRGLPLWYLLPDQRLLPPNSIGFFQVDPNWQEALIDGACSVGRADPGQAAAIQEMIGPLKARARYRARCRLAADFGLPPPRPEGDTEVPSGMSGFMLHSPLLTLYPGVKVKGKYQGAPVPLIRFETVAPNIAIALFDGLVDAVHIDPPPEGVFFGAELSGSNFTLSYRSMLTAAPVADSGVPMTSYLTEFQSMPEIQVLAVADWANDFVGTVPAADQNANMGVNNVNYALEMIAGTTPFIFRLNPPTSQQGY